MKLACMGEASDKMNGDNNSDGLWRLGNGTCESRVAGSCEGKLMMIISLRVVVAVVARSSDTNGRPWTSTRG